MTKKEFGEVLAMRLALWTKAQPLQPVTEGVWFSLLEPLTGEQAGAALMALARDGNPFAPEVGEIFKKAMAMSDETPDWGVAWRELRDNCAGTIAGTSWSHPVVRETAAQITLAEIGNSQRGDPAFEAQCRGVYETIRGRWQTGRRYAGIPGVDDEGRLAGPTAVGTIAAAILERLP